MENDEISAWEKLLKSRGDLIGFILGKIIFLYRVGPIRTRLFYKNFKKNIAC